MKVCIAEKPGVAKEIAGVIGATTRKDGYFEGNGYQVTWTFGHFCTLWPPEDYNPLWKRWDLNTLPMLPRRFETKIMPGNSGVKKQFNTIKTLFSRAKLVINCGDAGQEGELIQRWVIKESGYRGPVQRLWISSLTAAAIRDGFAKLKPESEFNYLYYAGSSRAIGDWLLGMNATRLYTLKYGAYRQVLSIGRVQTPTLAMLVNRQSEIENFKPQPYWELQTRYRDVVFNHSGGKFFVKADGQKLLEKISAKELFIVQIEKKNGREYAPKLFDLTSLQVFCNQKFSFTADETLKTIQRLYEMKMVTYPRVDTTYLPDDVFPNIPSILKGLAAYASFAEPLLKKSIRKSATVFNSQKVTDHHAIIPTGEEKLTTGNEQRVYDSIVRRFLGVFYPDCKVAKTKVEAEVAGVKFVAKGKEIIQPGWRILWQEEHEQKGSKNAENEQEDTILPAFEEGEHGEHEPLFSEKETKPPRHYTEATLLRAMETAGKQVKDEELRDLMKANGIGRPSTRAAIIETLFTRGYAERDKKKLLPTTMGIQLIGIIKNELLKSAELTGQWEKRLREIEQGQHNATTFINDMKRLVHELVGEVLQENSKVRLAPPQPKMKEKRTQVARQKEGGPPKTSTKCPKCTAGFIIKGKSAYGCSRWQEGCDFRLPFTFMGKKLTEPQIKRLIAKKQTTRLKGFVTGDQKVNGVVKLTDNFKVAFEPDVEENKKMKPEKPACPRCKKGHLVKGKTAYGCSRWQEGCDFRFSFQELRKRAKGRPLTPELVRQIVCS